MTAPTKEDAAKYLLQLRKHLVHALQQPNISPKRFNECREQILPLDTQLRARWASPICRWFRRCNRPMCARHVISAVCACVVTSSTRTKTA